MMKKILLLLFILSGMTGMSVYGMRSSVEQTEMQMSSQSYDGWLTVTSRVGIIYDDESTVIVTNNGASVDFDMNITILGFFTGKVHITGVEISGTEIKEGATGTVEINGKQYTVRFSPSSITDSTCNLNLTVESTPLGNLTIVFS
jgi:hypothetical protein